MNQSINAQILNKIGDFMYANHSEFYIKNNYFKDKIQLFNLSFPSSWNSDENLKADLKKNNIKSLLDLAANFFKAANLNPLTQENFDSEFETFYLQFQLSLEPRGRYQGYLKYQTHNFYVITDVEDDEGIRLLYNEMAFDAYKSMNEAQLFDYNYPTSENQYLIEALEVAIEAICNEFKIETELNKGVYTKKEKPNHKKDFAELLQLLTRNSIKPKDCKDVIQELIQIQTDPEAFIENLEMDNEYEEYFNADDKSSMNQWVLFAFLEDNDLIGNSDWKFDPEDLEMFVNDLSGHEIVFEVPAETYSAALFPYAKTTLDHLDLELINLNSNGDNYGFIIVNKNDVDRILALSQEYEIPLEKLY